MRNGLRWLVLCSLFPGVLGARRAEAQVGNVRPSGQDTGVRPSDQRPRLTIPPGLPRYEIDARLDLDQRKVFARQRVQFTNRTKADVKDLVFHVYPRFQVQSGDRLALTKTLEVLRLSPEEAMDSQGRRISVAAIRSGGKPLPFTFDPKIDTIMIVPLPRALAPDAAVVVEIDYTLDLPDFWGRWGHHHGITYLMNWYPVLAHHDANGWDRTPFVPWHQPWYQEAAHYRVRFDLPEKEVVASTGRIVRTDPLPGNRQLVTITGAPARDFALVCSDRFVVRSEQVGATRVRVVSFPEHGWNAERIMSFAKEVVPLYENWFGPYYDDEFEIAPSFFGWNGNECSGLVLLDDRVMRLPSAGVRYLDHLVTHETLHQWFWNVVGTDGYGETFMDEGIVNGITAIRLDRKYGRNAPLIAWSKRLNWLPTIGREDLRLAGYYGWRAHGKNGKVIQNMKEMGDLGALFSLAYDRGGKVIGMIYNRLGEDRFNTFFGKVYFDYAFKTFRYEDLKRELAAFDPTFDWARFLDGWLIEHKETDWKLARVSVGASSATTAPGTAPSPREITVEIQQKGEMAEPTVVLCRCGDSDLRVPIWPDRGTYDVPGAHVEHKPKTDTWILRVEAPADPSQVVVDPDHALLDAVPDNNRWKPEVSWRLTPFMTPADDSSQFQAYDRPSIVAGPFIDQYARGGFRFGAQRVDRWSITGWAGTEPALREAIFGGQATLYHFPWPKWSAGLFYEEGLYNFYNDQRHSGGRAFMRYRFLESPSFLLDDQGFAELYFGTGWEFWPGDDGRPVQNGQLRAFGGRFHLSTLFPYWDPIEGFEVDASAEYGNTAFGSSLTYTRATFEYGIVRPLPTVSGNLSKSRIALRVYGGYGSPSDAYLFRLGGGRRLRALDLSQQLGSSVWLVTAEWRYPLWREMDQDLLDHVLSVKNLVGAVFCDVGQSYFGDAWGPVVIGPGVGIRVDTALFAFLERATIRVDIAQPVNVHPALGPVLWFGLNQVF